MKDILYPKKYVQICYFDPLQNIFLGIYEKIFQKKDMVNQNILVNHQI